MPCGVYERAGVRVHGTLWGYKRGCRCPSCSAVHADAGRQWRSCTKEVRKEYQAAYRRRHPERSRQWSRNTKLKTKFGLTPEQYDTMLQQQQNRCAICHRERPTKRKLAVDHCHITNHVRGLLCSRCNGNLGWFEKNASSVQQYLGMESTSGKA